jgi:predicted transcriptional regulator YdeE
MTDPMSPEPRLVSLYGKYIVGWEVRTSNRDESSPDTARIPPVWDRAREENLGAIIRDQREPGVMLGAYTRYQSDDKGPYSLIVGVEVEDLDNIPQGMTGITVLAQEYAVFTAVGEMPQAVIDGWTAVWKYFSDNTVLTRVFSTDFERYDSAKPGVIEIYVAVR